MKRKRYGIWILAMLMLCFSSCSTQNSMHEESKNEEKTELSSSAVLELDDIEIDNEQNAETYVAEEAQSADDESEDPLNQDFEDDMYWPENADLTIKEANTEHQKKILDMLNQYGFYVIDVSQFNPSYHRSSCTQGTLGEVTVLCVSGEKSEAVEAWMGVYNNVLQLNGDDNVITHYEHDESGEEEKYLVEMYANGEYIRQVCIGDTYMMIAAPKDNYELFVQELFDAAEMS